jgi:hypothetical protein
MRVNWKTHAYRFLIAALLPRSTTDPMIWAE